MTGPYAFDVEISQNEYMPGGGTTMDAVVTVTCALGTGAGPAPRHPVSVAQVIMIDCSSSMTGAKLEQAKRATSAAIDALRDGVEFAVVAGTEEATMVHPATVRLATASDTARAQAHRAVRGLVADGGTAIGTWLDLARRLVLGHPAQIKHAILLTDGKNESQTDEAFTRDLERCRGLLVCDSRAVGVQWIARPLLEIADCLLGSAEGLPDPEGLTDDFLAITESVMGKMAPDVVLRVWTPTDAEITQLTQNHPRFADILGRRSPAGPRFTDHLLGHWGTELRDYHLRVRVPPGEVDDERAAARVSIVVGGEEFAERAVWIRWTDDPLLSTRVNPRVAGVAGQAELSQAIEQGLDARDAGRRDVATSRLGRAVRLATEQKRERTLKVLTRIVDVVDAPSGTVRLRAAMAEVDAELARLESRRTLRANKNRGAADADLS